MRTMVHGVVLACFVLLGGCCPTKRTLEAAAREKEPPQMIQIQSLTLTDKTLTLGYHVTNTFGDNIWVCKAPCVFNFAQDAGSRIDGDTLWITCRTKSEMETDIIILSNPPGIAKYLRLRPDESHSARIEYARPLFGRTFLL